MPWAAGVAGREPPARHRQRGLSALVAGLAFVSEETRSVSAPTSTLVAGLPFVAELSGRLISQDGNRRGGDAERRHEYERCDLSLHKLLLRCSNGTE